MALSGTFKSSQDNGANVNLDASNPRWCSFIYVKWTATQNIDDNTSTISWKCYGGSNYSNTTSYVACGPVVVKINGKTVLNITNRFNLSKDELIGSGSLTVSHNTDGTKSVPVSISAAIYNFASNCTYSGDITLNTIPRASTIDSLSCSTSYFNGTLTYKYTPQSASFYNRCNISLNLSGTYIAIKSINIGKKSASQQTATISLSSSELTTIYENLPSTTKGTLRFTFRTYSDSGYSDQIGDAGYKEVTLTIPTSVVPSIGEVELNPVNITTRDDVSRNLLVQGKNKLQILVRDCVAGAGSSIVSYTFSGPNITATTKSSTSTSYTFTSSNTISSTGELTYTVKITDKRGRTATKTAKVTCYAYEAPTFSSFSAYRCNSGGTADNNGTYVKYSLSVSYSSVNSTNKSTVKIYYKKNTSSAWTTATNALTDSTTKSAASLIKSSGSSVIFELGSTYSVYATVIDNYNGSTESSTITIFSSERIFNIRAKGKGIAFGKMAESDNLFESKWPMKVDGKITFGNGVQGSLYTDQNDSGVNIVYLLTGQDTSAGAGAGVALHNTSLYVPSASNSGIVNLGSSGRKWNQLYAASGTISTSDRNVKTNIEDMSDTQEKLFNELKPVTYKFIDGTSDRTHYGFISQDIEESLGILGLKGTDFAGFCKDVRVDEDGIEMLDENGKNIYDYSLRYAEFIALNTHMIQKLQAEIAELKATIEELKSTAQN